MVGTSIQLTGGAGYKRFLNLYLVESRREGRHTMVFLCVRLLFLFILFLCTPRLWHSRPDVYLTYCC